ncbi:MAG: GTP-binding protein HflX [Saprospiraceae bacterium]|jgi:GTP-binding protein HflX
MSNKKNHNNHHNDNNDWNLGEKQKQGLRKKKERAILVGVIQQTQSEELINEYLDELQFLAETAGAETIKRFVQKLAQPDRRTFVGSGKLDEIKDYIERHEEITLVIFDDDLTGKQTNIIEEHLKVKIVDRSSLILDIFANRAQTAQAKMQVDLAQMQYLLPRLRGLWTHLERQRGGIGMRGPGEKEIETDRRIIRDKIALLKKKLEKVDQQNITRRKNRGEMIRVSLVGYTNVGKSTIMNVISKSDVFAEDKLFATLDTTVRKVVFGTMPFLLSDTVGFIRKLPHHLVESFKSTLDEVRESDLILHVVDIAHGQFDDQIKTVNATLAELGVADKQTFYVFNKMDLYRDRYFDDYVDGETRIMLEKELEEKLKNRYGHDNVFLSALKLENIDLFREKVTTLVKDLYEIRYPYQAKYW